MSMWIALFACFFASPVHGLQAAASWPQSALRTETWTLPAHVHAADVDTIVFGNKEIGHFALPKVNIEGRRVRSEVFPPSYRYPVDYQLRLKNGKQFRLGSKTYVSPFAQHFGDFKPEVRGQLSAPFLLTSWIPQGDVVALPVVINRQGEIVWAAPAERNGHILLSALVEKISPQTYMLVGQGSTSQIRIVDARTGQLQRELRTPDLNLHHFFTYDSHSESVLSLAFECRALGYTQEFLAPFQGVMGWWNRLILPRRTYAGSSLVRIHLPTAKTERLWSTWQSFSFKDFPNLSLGYYRDRFANVERRGQYKRALNRDMFKTNWGFECHSDWSHENSVRHYREQGYLISQRNLNRISLIGEDGRLRWTVGNEARDTFRIRDVADHLGMQHDAQLLPDGRLLLFDNQTRFQGYGGGQRPNAVKILKLEGDTAHVETSFPLPLPASEYRGSVTLLPNGKIFAYQSGADDTPVRFYEIDPQSKSILAYLGLQAKGEQRAVSSRPQSAIADEIYLAPSATGKPAPLALSRAGEGPEFSNEGY
ncbi:MAG: hypothetical protein KF799_07690 [Bdellovibrionales bacterium]|nr:hypothetical protein [Bdellovibrionales bacterium]